MESQPKLPTFDPSPEVLQAVIDTGGVTDGSLLPRLKDLSPLEMRIELTIHKWKLAYRPLEQARERAGSKRQMRKQVKTLLEADEILKFWMPWLAAEQGFSTVLPSVISHGEIEHVAKWLESTQRVQGRRDESILAECALELKEIFRRSGARRTPWEKIGEIIADGIPEARAPRKSNLGNWIYQIVKRYRKRAKQQKPVV